MPDEPARPHLRVVTPDGELAGELCPHCHETDMAMRKLRTENTRIRNENAQLREVAPEHGAVRSVLEYHRELLMPGAKISEHTARWGVVHSLLKMKDDETGEALLTELQLRGAIVGMTLQPFIMDKANRFARDLTWAFTSQSPGNKPGGKPGPRFADPAQVQKHLDYAVTFKRQTGTSALGVLDELGGEGLRWLSERCSCSHTWLAHLRGGEAAQGGAQRCAVQDCDCGMFDIWHAQVERFKREQE